MLVLVTGAADGIGRARSPGSVAERSVCSEAMRAVILVAKAELGWRPVLRPEEAHRFHLGYGHPPHEPRRIWYPGWNPPVKVTPANIKPHRNSREE